MRAGEAYVFFNNGIGGYAVQNVLRLKAAFRQ